MMKGAHMQQQLAAVVAKTASDLAENNETTRSRMTKVSR
jgi:hypothetical protein